MRCSCPLIRNGLGWDEDLVTAVCRRVTTTPPPSTRRPPACALPEGDALEAGRSKVVPEERGCRKYVCDGRGQLDTIYGDCVTPNCVTPVRRPGACCMACPDGK